MGMCRSLKFGNALEFLFLLLAGGFMESLLDQVGYGVGVDLAAARRQNLQQGCGRGLCLLAKLSHGRYPRTPISAVPCEY